MSKVSRANALCIKLKFVVQNPFCDGDGKVQVLAFVVFMAAMAFIGNTIVELLNIGRLNLFAASYDARFPSLSGEGPWRRFNLTI